MKPDDVLLYTFFERNVANSPNKAAIEYGGRKYTYEEVHQRVNSVVAILVEKRINVQDSVCVLLDKSVDSVAILLAILKIGAIYIPLDNRWPQERISYVLSNSSPKLIVTEKNLHTEYYNKYENNVCFIEDFGITNKTNVAKKHCTSEHIAYVIYTSGSTGLPKGVVITHRSICNTILSLVEKYYIDSNSKLLYFSSPAFDSAIAEIFTIFAASGTLVIPDNFELEDIKKLQNIITSSEITTVTLPPSLIAYLDFSKFPSLATLISAGEELSPNIANKVRKEVKHLINAYGPTECSVCATTYEVTTEQKEYVPIGKPIQNISIFLFDEELNAIQNNNIGELHISGIGLAKGYLNDGQRTKEKFIYAPFESDRVLYRTGDLVKFDEEGNLVFVGRSDSQVKINGQRVEIGDIENCIRSHPEIINAVVLLKKISSDVNQIVCYYTSHTHLDINDLKGFVKKHLPRYMVPSSYYFLASFPLLPNGKLDRIALAELPLLKKLSKVEKFSNFTEKKLYDIWKDLFGETGIQVNFFECGGDSLLAMKLVSEINTTFNVDIELTTVFEYPTIHELAKIIVDKQSQTVKKTTTFQSTTQPLSEMQKIFWVQSKINSQNKSNNIVKIFSVKGNFDYDAFKNAIEVLAGQHQLLRTIFKESEGKPYRITLPEIFNPIERLTLKRSEFKSKVDVLASNNFEIGKVPPWKVTLLTDEFNNITLVITLHHIIFDGTSSLIFFEDLLSYYEKIVSGTSISGTNETELFDDYVKNENKNIDSNIDFQFWETCLINSMPESNFPYDYSRNLAKYASKGNVFSLKISNEFNNQLKIYCRNQKVTKFLFTLAAFNIFAHRYIGQDDILIGTPVGLRGKKDYEKVIGPLINTIPLRSKININDSFIGYLNSTKNNFYQTLKHAHVPFSTIVDHLNPDRQIGTNPFFSVMFEYQKEVELWQSKNITLQATEYNPKTSKFDLTFSLIENEKEELSFLCEYASDIFKKSSIERMMENYITLLGSIVKNSPNVLISDLKVLTQKEKDLVTYHFNDTDYDFGKDNFLTLFKRQVLANSESIAVSCEGKSINYQKLDRDSDALAIVLSEKGVKANSLIGILMDRSIDLVVSILAIWKIGAAYIPIEPDFPQKRINDIISEANILCVISHSTLSIKLELIAKNKRIYFDDYDFSKTNSKKIATIVEPHSLAYSIFTSGSTNKPKGVLIHHAGMMNHLHIMIDYFKLDSSSIIAQNASHCFDISVWQLTCALLVGGKIVIYPKEVVLQPELFLRKIISDTITILEIVPSYLNILLELIEDTQIDISKSLRYLIPTGETIKVDLIERWQNNFPKIKIVNAYGPAEASDDTHFYLIDKPINKKITAVPVGKPLKNIKTYVLDKDHKICPIGVPGEICIAGIAVGKGYINNPTQTHKSFIKNMIVPHHGTIYLTGDLGKWNENGEIEFLGRKDFQVKIRGYRIELGEIEHHLTMHPDIIEAVVIVHENNTGAKQLVAYYTRSNEDKIFDLRSYLSELLPGYMIPSFFVELTKMPLNNSGKIDRKSLPKDINKSAKTEVFTKYNEKLLNTLSLIWKEVLKNESVKSQDNFFEIGGDSLLAMQIVSKIRNHGYTVTMRDIFTHQSIEALASNIKTKVNSRQDIKNKRSQTLKLSPVQRDFLNLNIKDKNHYVQAVSIQVDNLNKSLLQDALCTLISKHEMLQCRLNKDLSIFLTNDVSTFKLKNLPRKYSLELLTSSIDIYQQPFDAYFGEGRLILIAHHFIIDIFSWSVLLADLEKICESILSKEVLKSGEVEKTTYFDWVNNLQTYYMNEGYQELDYWRNVDAKITILFPKKVKTIPGTNLIKFSLGDSSKYLLLNRSRDLAQQPHIVFITCLFRACKKLTNTSEISILYESHGRNNILNNIDVSQTVGWFTTLYPVVFTSPMDGSLEQDIQMVKNTLEAVPNFGHGYGFLKHNDKSEIKHTPQLIFNYIGKIHPENTLGLLKDITFQKKELFNTSEEYSEQIEVDVYFEHNELFVEIKYPSSKFDKKLILKLSNLLQNEINTVITSNMTKQASNNFDLITIDQSRLKILRAKFQ